MKPEIGVASGVISSTEIGVGRIKTGRLLIYRVRISSWISSWIFELGFFAGILIFSGFTQPTLSMVLHIASTSFQNGGERGLQIGWGNLLTLTLNPTPNPGLQEGLKSRTQYPGLVRPYAGSLQLGF